MQDETCVPREDGGRPEEAEGWNQFSSLRARDDVLTAGRGWVGGRPGQGVAVGAWEDRDTWFGPLGGALMGRDWKKPGSRCSGEEGGSCQCPQDTRSRVLKAAENPG